MLCNSIVMILVWEGWGGIGLYRDDMQREDIHTGRVDMHRDDTLLGARKQ